MEARIAALERENEALLARIEALEYLSLSLNAAWSCSVGSLKRSCP